jgi:Cell wall-active antibiotics response 4TMS YvqF
MSATTMRTPTTHRPLLVAVALLLALGAGLYFSGIWPVATVPVVRESVSQPLGAATRADVTIAIGMGKLRLSGLDQPGALVAGEIAYPDQNRVTRAFAIDGDTASFTLREQDSQAHNLVKYQNDDAIWDLRLSPATPMALTLEAGVGENTIDLARLRVTDLTLHTGIGSTTLTLPRQGQVQAQIESGVGETIIRIPAGVAVHLEISGGIGTTRFPDSYKAQGKAYVSPGYATAVNRVDLTVSRGIGDITIQQISE